MQFNLQEQLDIVTQDLNDILADIDKNKKESLKLAFLDIQKRALVVKYDAYKAIQNRIIQLIESEEVAENLTKVEDPWGEIQQ